jgi:gamma-tubulin complex component 3
MPKLSDHDIENALFRLVRSTVGPDADSLSLARHINRTGKQTWTSATNGQANLKVLLQDIVQELPDKESQRKLKALLDRLETLYDGAASNAPASFVEVLTELAESNGQRPVMPLHHPTITKTEVNENDNRRSRSFEEAFLEAFNVEEQYVLRECLYALQGINGERIRFVWKNKINVSLREDTYEGIRVRSEAIDQHQALPPSLLVHSKLGSGSKDAIRMCCEAGWLYSRIADYLSKVQSIEQGAVLRAFASSLTEEMHSYQCFLARLEESHPYSIRQMLLELRPPISRLRILATLVDGLVHISGGPLLTALYLHMRHGDSRHGTLLKQILHQSSRPWFQMLSLWTTQGLLMDPFEEFFVEENEGVADHNLWSEGYSIKEQKVPIGVVDEGLVLVAFSIGKGINFIRKSLQDGEWRLKIEDKSAISESTLKEPRSSFFVEDSSISRINLDSAALQVHSHILTSLHDRHHLLQHLFALKQFLLLGQGDFYSSLLDGIHQEFEGRRGIVGVYRHTLAAIVDSALRGTNASDFPEFVLKRLQVELRLSADEDARYMFGCSKESDADVRTVWDIFLLEYSVPDPLVAIVHAKAVESYRKLFLFLFNLRRVEFMLNLTWRHSAVLQHALQTAAQHNGINVSISKAYAQATVLLRQIAITRQSMMHFVVNLKSYLMFEVLEGGWKQLVHGIEESKTLDQVIATHDDYLSCLLRKGLLDGARGGSSEGPDVAKQFERLFYLSDEFCAYQQEMFGEAQESADRAAVKRREAEERLNHGHWGFSTEKEVSEEETFFGLADATKLFEADRISASFDEQVVLLLQALDQKLNGVPLEKPLNMKTPPAQRLDRNLSERDEGDDDLDSLRFLTFQLDHNKFYGLETAT